MGRKATVLVVDDEPDIRLLAADVLGHLGYEVIEAANGDEALHIVAERDGVDLLFTDIRMPGKLDGFGLARAASAIRPNLRIVYTTGFANIADRDQVPGSLFLRKPWTSAGLAQAFDRLLKNGGTDAR